MGNATVITARLETTRPFEFTGVATAEKHMNEDDHGAANHAVRGVTQAGCMVVGQAVGELPSVINGRGNSRSDNGPLVLSHSAYGRSAGPI